MKIAYCFSGHLRTFLKNETIWPMFFQCNPIGDMFVHTYRYRNFHGMKWHADDDGYSDEIGANEINVLLENYPAIKVLAVDAAVAGHEYMPDGLKNCGFRHTRQAVNESRQRFERDKNVSYDMVVMMRFDIGFLEPFILPDCIEQNTLYASYNGNMVRQELDSDVITYGTPDVIDRINIPAIPENIPIDPSEMTGEKLCTAVRNLLGIDYKTHRVRHFFYRSEGELHVNQ